MAFFKFRQRGQTQPERPTPGRRSRKVEAAADPQENIETVRRRARHRLLGAVVLVGIAVVGFPLLFDTQPRPIAVNAPIIIPDKDAAGPLQGPGSSERNQPSVPASASLDEREEVVIAGTTTAATATDTAPASLAARERADSDASAQRARQDAARSEAEAKARREAEAKAKREEEAAARARREQQRNQDTASADAEREAAIAAAQEARAKREAEAEARRDADAEAKAEAKAKAKREAEAKAQREAEAKARKEAQAKAKREEAARARALLEGRGTADAKPEKKADEPATKGRFIVQVGAFTDDDATRRARQKAEAAGVKTYTQVVETSAGKRTRVRVGPFGSREEAEKAAAALKKAGLGGVILGL